MPSPGLVAVIEGVLAARGTVRVAAELRFRCALPDHADRHPSARWHRERAVWWCDVCGVGGGAVALARLLGIAVGGRSMSATVRRGLTKRSAEQHERQVVERDARARWLVALTELRAAQAGVDMLRALVRDDPDEHDPRTATMLDALGDPYLREQLAEQRLDAIERDDRARREGVRRAAA